MPLSAGTALGPYDIVQMLGEGGMGVVYKALDTRLKRFVAIKVLRAETLADPERRRRFVQEAQSASALNHPNIITIYDIGEQDGIDYIAMEYVSGKTLDALIPRKGMRLNEVLRIAVQIAAGLERAHAAGIVHRDLKPGNVMVGQDGQVKVLDFGLAKLSERATVAEGDTETVRADTKEGTIVGTAAYMSPEQAEGVPVDARSDIFSFGSVLYEMVTGERAFKGQSGMSTMAAILNQEPKPVSTLAPEVPRDLEKIIHRCLRKDPDRRFHAMADVRVALLELKEESDSGLLAGGAASAVQRRSRRAWIFAAIAILVLVGTAGLWFRQKSATPARQLKTTLLTSEPGIHRAPALSPDGKQVAYTWRAEGDPGASIYLRLADAGTPLRLTTNDPSAFDISPAWSPDGRYIAFCRVHQTGAADILTIAALGGPARHITSFARCAGISWSPNGDVLAVAASEAQEPTGIFFISSESGQKRKLTSPPPGYYGDMRPRFSPSGKQVLFIRGRSDVNRDLYVVSIGTDGTAQGQPRKLEGIVENPSVWDADWMADGGRVVFSGGNVLCCGSLHAISASGGSPSTWPEAGDRVRSVSVSRAGNRLVFERVNIDSNLWRISSTAHGSDPPTRIVASTEADEEAQYSPDGKRLVFVSDRSGSVQLWTCDADGRNPMQVTSTPGLNPGSPRWSPDGAWLAFDSPRGGQYDVLVISASGGSPRPLTTEPSNESRPSWSRDGRWIYFGSNRTGDSQIWKAPAAGGSAVQVTRTGGEEAFESVDGKYVYWAKRGIAGIWRMPAVGGEEVRIIESSGRNFFSVARPGVWFFDVDPGTLAVSLKAFDEKNGTVRVVRELPKGTEIDNSSTTLSASSDGKWTIYTQRDQVGSNLVMLDGIR